MPHTATALEVRTLRSAGMLWLRFSWIALQASVDTEGVGHRLMLVSYKITCNIVY